MMRVILTLLLYIPFTSFGQVVFDGTINEARWDLPLGTSVGGPAPCFGAGHEINSLYASNFDNHIGLGIGGNVQDGNRIMVFIDSKPGGFNNGNFGRTSAPPAINNFNSGTTFDAGFTPDYCLVIGTDNTRSNFYFNLFTLAGTAIGGGGSDNYLGNAFASSTDSIAANPANGDATRGFEIALRKADIGYNSANQQVIKLMMMYSSDGGYLANQFISQAGSTDGCYTNGTIAFQSATPNPVSFDPTLTLPIDFIQLSSKTFDNSIRIFWSAAREQDMKQYEIERSNNALIFQQVAIVNALGNSNTAVPYSWPDPSPNIGVNYYRIRAVDRNGKKAYSPVLRVFFGSVDNSLTIFPNPVVDQRLNLRLVSITRGDYTLDIFNNLGQKIFSQSIVHSGGLGLQTILLPAHLKKGPYRLILMNDRDFYKQSFIIQ